jgi:ketosteroid isomerase-like protein
MEKEPRVTSVSPSEKTIPIDRDKTLVSPRFDEKSVQRARPAVPFARGAALRFGSSGVLVACIIAGLIGGVAGGLALALYQKRNAVGSQPPAVAGAPSTSSSSSPPVVAAVVDEAPPAAPAAASVEATAPASSSEVARAGEASVPSPNNEGEAARGPGGTEEAELRGALDEWIAATNARDIGRQMDFYGERVGAFYRTRNVPREAVRAEKTRVFGNADTIDIRAAPPAVRLSRDGQTATMRFRKKYNIEGGGQERRGEVLQELRWRRTPGGWKIVSERDLRVIN